MSTIIAEVSSKGVTPPVVASLNAAGVGFRSSAVARMLGMPVATLRVWERRYALCQPPTTPSGQRLYSQADVQRLAVLKRLTDVGHAIGQLAALDLPKLQAVAATHATTLAGSATARNAVAAVLPIPSNRVLVIGTGLAARLQRPAVLRQVARKLHVEGPFATAADAGKGLRPDVHIDAVLVHAPSLTPTTWSEIDAALPQARSASKAVLYGFAATATCEQLAAAGVALLREPQSDMAVGQWLRNVLQEHDPMNAEPTVNTSGPVPQRRWTDAALTDFAGLSSTVACECPKHVAELLIQLSQFEHYSADCENRSPADAALHKHLWQVAAQARASFEQALEYVAMHEGLTLPAETSS
jgi:MerR family transcriptional regulator, light-induced transcriptional regulator